MKNLIRLEEATMFLLSIYLFSLLPYAWWWFLVLILAPDLSMFGYVAGPKVGAVCYNIAHHKGVAILVYIIGAYWHNEGLMLAGVILFGHSSMDRVMGYGLKYPDDFKHTHLGQIGK